MGGEADGDGAASQVVEDPDGQCQRRGKRLLRLGKGSVARRGGPSGVVVSHRQPRAVVEASGGRATRAVAAAEREKV